MPLCRPARVARRRQGVHLGRHQETRWCHLGVRPCSRLEAVRCLRCAHSSTALHRRRTRSTTPLTRTLQPMTHSRSSTGSSCRCLLFPLSATPKLCSQAGEAAREAETVTSGRARCRSRTSPPLLRRPRGHLPLFLRQDGVAAGVVRAAGAAVSAAAHSQHRQHGQPGRWPSCGARRRMPYCRVCSYRRARPCRPRRPQW